MKADSDAGRAYLAMAIALIIVLGVVATLYFLFLAGQNEESARPPKPPTLGAEEGSRLVTISGKDENIEYANTKMGAWCISDSKGAFTAEAATRLRERFIEKYAGSRSVMTWVTFPAGPHTETYCILYNKKGAPLPQKTTSASAEVFYFDERGANENVLIFISSERR
ncbi:MAG: hypothetical protein Q8Q36_01310 [bacterium]|nr:hypothetical protein [bacterium]